MSNNYTLLGVILVFFFCSFFMNQYIVSNQQIFQQLKLSLSETMKTTKITRKPKIITLLSINITSTKTKATYLTSTTTKVETEHDDLLILTWTKLNSKSWHWFGTNEGFL